MLAQALLLAAACAVHGAPGDTLVRADFRAQDWSIWSVDGTGTDSGAVTDKFQNTLRGKDDGQFKWSFESPPGWFAGDKSLAYNGVLQVALQAISWTGSFVPDFDVVLVSSKKRLSLGVKGLRRDGDTTRTYNVPLNEKGGWTKVNPAPRHSSQSNVTAEDFILCLNTLVGLRIRGGFYSGREETQLRSVSVVLGQMAGDAPHPSTAARDQWTVDASCQSAHRYDIVFDNPGIPCSQWQEVSSGLLSAVPAPPPAAVSSAR